MIQNYKVFKHRSDDSIEFLRMEVSDHFFPVHYHKRVCIGRIEKGSMEINFRDTRSIYKKDDTFIILPFTTHSCTIRMSAAYCALCFPDSYIGQDRYPDSLLYGEYERHELLRLIRTEYQNALLTENSVEIVKKLTGYIKDLPLNQIRIDHLSCHVNISQSHLQHVFKTKTGMCLKDFIIQEKMRTAKTLLLHNDIPDVVYECGFYDQSHFSRNFKKITGLTPLRYAQSITIL